MDLAPWRNLAIILLALEAMFIVAVPGVLFFFALKGIRAVKRLIRPPLLQVQVWAQRIEKGTDKATNAVAVVPINIWSTSAGITATVRILAGELLGR